MKLGFVFSFKYFPDKIFFTLMRRLGCWLGLSKVFFAFHFYIL